MTIRLNEESFTHAKKLIQEERVALDDRDAWSEHQPSAEQENAFIEENGYAEYALWYLAIDDDETEGTKARYKFPYGDFENVHRCGVLAAKVRAAQRKHSDVEKAAEHLDGMLDAVMERREAS